MELIQNFRREGFCDRAADWQRVVASTLKGSPATATEMRIFFQPMASGGCGVQNLAAIGKYAFLGSALLAFEFIKANYARESHILQVKMKGVLDGSVTTPYAVAVRSISEEFYELFTEVNGREPTIPLDGFDRGSGLSVIARKFQARAANLLAEKEARDINRYLSATQQVAQRSFQAAPAYANMLSAMPAPGLPPIPNAVFSLILKERLLDQSIGGIEDTDECPGKGKGCLLQNPLTLDHLRGCVHANSTKGAKCQPHETVQETVRSALKGAGVRIHPVDLRCNMAVAGRFAAAGVPLSPSGFNEGGDLLCVGLDGANVETVADVTFINPTSAAALARQSGNPAVNDAEGRKVKEYTDLYRKIGITSVIGLAMDRCGNLGSVLKKTLKKCGQLFDELPGAPPLPPWANWTCPKYHLAWGQALVVKAQVEYATHLLEAIAEVHAARALRGRRTPRRTAIQNFGERRGAARTSSGQGPRDPRRYAARRTV